jgi:hypothetical protein
LKVIRLLRRATSADSGLPLTYEVLSGNTADKTTLRTFVKKIEHQYGKAANRIWLMDRGHAACGMTTIMPHAGLCRIQRRPRFRRACLVAA